MFSRSAFKKMKTYTTWKLNMLKVTGKDCKTDRCQASHITRYNSHSYHTNLLLFVYNKKKERKRELFPLFITKAESPWEIAIKQSVNRADFWMVALVVMVESPWTLRQFARCSIEATRFSVSLPLPQRDGLNYIFWIFLFFLYHLLQEYFFC